MADDRQSRLVSDERVRAERAGLTGTDTGRPELTPEAREIARKAALHARLIDAWKEFAEADRGQREREVEDLKFYRGWTSDHWDEDLLKNRAARVENGVSIAARPCLTINKLKQPVRQIINEAVAARLGIQVSPKGRKASSKGADLRQRMIRSIERDSNAAAARMWALGRAIICGRGYYRLKTDFANDGDFDQDILVTRILNQGSVYYDPWAVEPSGDDAEMVFIVEDLKKEHYTRKFPRSRLATEASANLLTSATNLPEGWYDGKQVRIAEAFYVEHRPTLLVLDPTSSEEPRRVEMVCDEETQQWTATEDIPAHCKQRQIDVRRVKHCVFDGLEVLEEHEWGGRYLPVIPVYGELVIVDGKERVYKGVISDGKDAQRSYNYMRSGQVEAIAVATKAPYIVFDEQIRGYEGEWRTSSTTNYPYLRIRAASSVSGQPFGFPKRNIEEPAIQAISVAANFADADVKATTGRFDPSLGQVSGERSGRAINALKQQGEVSSSHFLEEFASNALVYEGKQHLDLMPVIYDRPGRVIRLLGEKPGDEMNVMLGVPFVHDADGHPVPMPAPIQENPNLLRRTVQTLGRMVRGSQGASPEPEVQEYTLADGGEYMCAVSVGQSRQTEREENLAILSSLLESTKGAVAPLVIDYLAEQMPGSLGKDLAARFRRLNPQLRDDAGEQTGSPEEVAALKQQLQQAQQQLQALAMQLKSESYKVDAQVAMKQAELTSRAQIDLARIRADIAKAQAQLESDEAIAILQAEEKRLEAEIRHASAIDLERLKGVQRRRDIALEKILTGTIPSADTMAHMVAPSADDEDEPGLGRAFDGLVNTEVPTSPVRYGPSGQSHDPRGPRL